MTLVKPRAYYNEIDKLAAEWLRELIRRNLIAPGEVDERSIEDVAAADLRGFNQCHFFAGIGVWSYALRLAQWGDSEHVWTGSCPCGPWSDAGQKKGFDDPRHLWPAWFRLIGECKPRVVLGEQVASKAGLFWLDAVSADVEAAGYAIGAFDLCAAGVGAPHIRQRLYWVADANKDGCERLAPTRLHGRRPRSSGDESAQGDVDRPSRHDAAGCGEPLRLGDADSRGSTPRRIHRRGEATQERSRRTTAGSGDTRGLVDHERARLERLSGHGNYGDQPRRISADKTRSTPAASATRGFWGGADWVFCRDEKWRPVESGTFPLADGTPDRVGRLRCYGNAIVAEQAVEFIEAYRDVVDLAHSEDVA